MFWAGILQGGGGVRVQVRRNFHILTSKKKPGGGTPTPPPGSATVMALDADHSLTVT